MLEDQNCHFKLEGPNLQNDKIMGPKLQLSLNFNMK
jgi:hypothetical protein